jgi:hypothetical protein
MFQTPTTTLNQTPTSSFSHTKTNHNHHHTTKTNHNHHHTTKTETLAILRLTTYSMSSIEKDIQKAMLIQEADTGVKITSRIEVNTIEVTETMVLIVKPNSINLLPRLQKWISHDLMEAIPRNGSE